MIVHVCNFSPLIPPFVKFVNEEFGMEKHQFWLATVQKRNKFSSEKADNIFVGKRTLLGQLQAYFRLFLMLHRADKVILHGLFNPRVITLLACCPWLLAKSYWVIWGGDLYAYQIMRSGLMNRIRERLRRRVISRVGHLVTYIEGDVERARQWYSATGVYHECLMYLSNVFDPCLVPTRSTEKKPGHPVIVLVGNSADPSNNHLDTLKKLLRYKEQGIKIYVPLSYGDQEHAKIVIQAGKELFGGQFIPLIDFMPLHDYLKLLEQVDVAIFNHARQQAMGNTISLLGMGKTVYIRSDTTPWSFLGRLGIKLSDTHCLGKEELCGRGGSVNARIVEKYFSSAKLAAQLGEIFE